MVAFLYLGPSPYAVSYSLKDILSKVDKMNTILKAIYELSKNPEGINI